MKIIPAANSTFAIGGVSCSADILVVAENFMLRINIYGENPAHCKSANRWRALEKNTVKQIFYILTFLTFATGSTVYGQRNSAKVDSLTSIIFNDKVDRDKDKYAFKSIIDHRQESNLGTHLDTTKGDFICIVEFFFYQDSSVTSKEEYFHAGDSIPRTIYLSDTICDVKKLYTSIFGREKERIQDEELFNPKIKKIKSYTVYQELDYNKTQTRTHGCVDNDRNGNAFKEIRTEQLKGTYVIYTLIDNQTNNILISFQYAPNKPKFKIDTYNPVWDF